MAQPNFPVSVPTAQSALISQGDQNDDDGSIRGFTESHRGAKLRVNSTINPADNLLWSDGPLRSE